MRLVDSRLIRQGGVVRLGSLVLLRLAQPALLVAQALVLGELLAELVTEARLDAAHVAVLALVLPARAILAWAAELVTHRMSVAVRADEVPGVGAWSVRARRRHARQRETLRALARHFLDLVAGLGTLAAFGRAGAQVGAIRRMAEIQRRARLVTVRSAALTALWVDVLALLVLATVLVVLTRRVVDGTVDLALALSVLLLALEVYRRRPALDGLRPARSPGTRTSEDVHTLLDAARHTGREGERGGAFVDARSAPIRLEDVTLLRTDRATPVLHQLSLDVPLGRFTGIVGPSGAGKSTVLALIAGLVRPDHGRVTVGDVDLADVDLAGWRSQLGWLSQDPALFAGTVAENIALARPDSEEAAVRSAARAAAVDVPLDLLLGEGGRGLSAGQRRRVALARALVGDPAVLLLDEPTESVDPETEAVVLDTMRHTLAGRTVVVVTHRPALLASCHHVVRLDVRQDVPA